MTFVERLAAQLAVAIRGELVKRLQLTPPRRRRARPLELVFDADADRREEPPRGADDGRSG
jgi:hypothetical protein